MPNVALAPTVFGWTPGQAGVGLTPATDLTTIPSGTTTVTFPNYNGNVILVINNGYTAPITVQPVAVRTVEQQSVSVPSYSLANGKMQAFGPFPPNDFNVAGQMTVNLGSVAGAGVTAAAFQFAVAPSQL